MRSRGAVVPSFDVLLADFDTNVLFCALSFHKGNKVLNGSCVPVLKHKNICQWMVKHLLLQRKASYRKYCSC